MTLPKWKQAVLKAKSDLGDAETKARHESFWAAVDKRPKLIEDQPDYGERDWPRDGNGSPIDDDFAGPIG